VLITDSCTALQYAGYSSILKIIYDALYYTVLQVTLPHTMQQG